MSKSEVSPTEEEVPFDDLAAASYYAVTEGVDASQVNKLLEVLESTKSVKSLLLFLVRQVSRRGWGRGTSARYLFQVLRDLEGKKSIEDVRRILGLFKWLYEAGRERGRYFPRMDPGMPAKEGFFYEYLERCLSR